MSSLTRDLYAPTASVNKFTTPVPVDKGGTGGTNAIQAVENLGGIPLSKANQANGWPALTEDLVLDIAVIPDVSLGGPTLKGPSNLIIQTLGQWTITNYNSQHAYVITTDNGFVSRNEDTIYYKAPSIPGVYSFTVDGKVIPVVVNRVTLTQPTILSPVDTQSHIVATVVEEILYAHDSAQNDQFGTSVALSSDGQRLAVGSIGKDTLGLSNSGKVYIYIKSGTSWVFESQIIATDAAIDDNFGRSVAFDANGTRLAVGAPLEDPGATVDAGKVYIYTRSGASWVLESMLNASDKLTLDWFGTSVALDSTGTRLAVGAPGRTVTVADAGQVYVYTRTGSVWTLETTLSASDKTANDQFGTSVAINADGSKIAVGSPLKDVTLADAGKVYVYTRNGVAWTEVQTVVAYDKAANDQFGISVALSSSGSRLIVGTHQKPINGYTKSGKLYGYILVDNVWTQELELTSINNQMDELFGYSVAFTDTTLCVGAIQTNQLGAVYTYDLSYENGSYVKQRAAVNFTASSFGITGNVLTDTLSSNEAASADRIGYAIAIGNAGNLLAIGAIGRTVSGVVNAGKVYLYTRSGSSWIFDTALTASDGLANDYYGSSIAITANGDRIVIGAMGKDVSGTTDAGRVYIYVKSGTSWIEESVLSASDMVTGDAFGSSVALDSTGTRLVVGAPNKTVSASANAGKVYIYTRSGSVWIQETTLTDSIIAANLYFGTAVAFNANGDLLAIGIVNKTATTSNCGTVALYSRTGSTWSFLTELTAAVKQTGAQFGRSIAFDSTGTKLAIGADLYDSDVTNTGLVYIFRYINSTWTQASMISDLYPEVHKRFGTAVAFNNDGSRLLTSAVGLGDLANAGIGTGVVYELLISEHEGSDWQLATDASFNDIVDSTTNNAANLTTWQVTGLLPATDYYIRVRYKGTNQGYSEWSPVIQLTTYDEFIPNIELGVLSAHDKAANDNYGIAVALSGNGEYLAVGAYNRDVSGNADAGKVYIYIRSGITWILDAEITAADLVASDQFGRSVSLDYTGSRLAVGAYSKTVSAIAGAGQVYIFTRSGSTWTQESTVSASDKAANDNFGTAVTLDSTGIRMAVGAYAKTVAGTTVAGKVYIYTRSGSVWTEESTLVAYDKATSDRFGAALSFNGDSTWLAVGAYLKDVTVTDSGKVYLYTRIGSTWNLQFEISAADKVTLDWFGASVALSANAELLAVGAFGRDPGAISAAGQVYLYRRVSGEWIVQPALTASNKAANDWFGVSVAMDATGSKLVTGASSKTADAVAGAGQVYIFG